MDVNANMLPVTPAANSAKESPRDKQIDENQAPALPFQAMLENQQSPEKNSENSPTLNGSANETPLNQQISEQKQSEATTVASDKPAPETLATDKPMNVFKLRLILRSMLINHQPLRLPKLCNN